MTEYFRPDESIGYRFGKDDRGILTAIANRFIGSNPSSPFVFRTFHEKGILCDPCGQYVFDFGARFRDLPGNYAYAFGKLWSEYARNSNFSIVCYGPVRVMVNGDAAFDSKEPAGKTVFPVKLEKGWNSFFLRFERIGDGFGCLFGNAMPQWEPCNFYAPFSERDGKAGFVFTAPQKVAKLDGKGAPGPDSSEAATGIRWLPDGTWPIEMAGLPAVCRVFEGLRNGFVYAWTRLEFRSTKPQRIHMKGKAYSPVRLWAGGCLTCLEPGEFSLEKEFGYGKYDILVECSVPSLYSGPNADTDNPGACRWGFRLEAFQVEVPRPVAGHLEAPRPEASQTFQVYAPIRFTSPCNVKGCVDPWLFLGPFDHVPEENPEELLDFYRLFENKGQGLYWRVDEKDTALRPFVENALYGRWTYPLGVTLYGLLCFGEASGQSNILDYVREQVKLVAKVHEYAMYDKKKYGFPGVNHQIAWLDALDDCGSYGSLMLECNSRWQDDNADRIAGIIADHMMNRQLRREDGTFYRGNDTMWVDDLYMSVPFLRRYWQKTRKPEYLDEACRQILLFEKYLYMKDWNVMSHIYSFMEARPTNIPWGRGNGWAIFSISELLEVLPADHKDYEPVTNLYNRLVKGYMALQGENGLWHQVLNRKDTYEEASCTAMFICAFVRGIRKGYLDREMQDAAASSACRAWEGLIAKAVDYQGNIYGVCRGSGFSFSSDYYRDLSWNFNDTHGTGILILAGTEIMRLEEYFTEKSAG